MALVLGISAFYHDSAAALIKNGEIISAAQEERFTRKKHDASFPINSIKFLLNYSNIKLNDIDFIVFYEKPFLKFERLLETYLAFAPKGFFQFLKSMPIWMKDKLFQKNIILKNLNDIEKINNLEKKLFFSEHHLSHASSAFYPSPFNKAIIVTADGVGEWATTTIAIGDQNKISIKKEIRFPHSLGLLYSSFTSYLGFKVNSGEYKMMGLAPYGEPKYLNEIYKIVEIKEDGSFYLNQKYFNYSTGFTMTNSFFHNLFKKGPRNPETDKIEKFHMDVAASIQKVTEVIMIKICKFAKKTYDIDNLCLAGGVALNCVANGKLQNEKIFENIWIQPASGDAGGAIGSALAFWHIDQQKKREINSKDGMKGSYLGPEYSNDYIEKELKFNGAKYKTLNYSKIIQETAELLKNKMVVGWFQGRMEFGPRALGSRSIIADPRCEKMQKNLNLKIKFRESFRPFAPSILKEDLNKWFDLEIESPYMMLVSKIKHEKRIHYNKDDEKSFGIEKLNIKRSQVPAITHVDYSARIQTVNNKTNPIYYDLIKCFKEKTGCPIIVNTSFNVRGEPLVNTPTDAFKCFMGSQMDYLVIGNFLLDKKDQDPELFRNYEKEFELD